MKPTWNGHITPSHHISYAFSCGDKHYFNFTDAFNIPSDRAHDALRIYEMCSIKCDEQFLRENNAAKNKIYLGNPINVFELKKLDDQLLERLDMVLPPRRQTEMLASVYYFDESENPYAFDGAYAEMKINNWRRNRIRVINEAGEEKESDFFLSPPIRSLMPCSTLPEEDFQTFLNITDQIDEHHLQTIFKWLSSQQQKTSLYKKHYSNKSMEEMSV